MPQSDVTANLASTPATAAASSSTIPPEFEEYSVEVDDSEVNENDSIKAADDPFQEQRKLSKTEEAAIEVSRAIEHKKNGKGKNKK